jgi:hypothetical protein
MHQYRSLPNVRITLNDDEVGRPMYEFFRSRTLGFPYHQWGTWGRAAMMLPETLSSYTKGKSRHPFRTNCMKASRLDYEAVPLTEDSYVQGFRDCFRSTPVRQGSPVEMENWPYPGEPANREMMLSGCVDSAGDVIAVSRIVVSGQTAWMRNLIGHADHVNAGVMYLLMQFCVERLIAERSTPWPTWLMFDSYFSVSAGMRYFLDRIGMSPHNIRFDLGSPDLFPIRSIPAARSVPSLVGVG